MVIHHQSCLIGLQLLTMEFTKGNVHYKLSHTDHVPSPMQEMSFQQLDKEFYSSNLGMFLYSIESGKIEASDLDSYQLIELQKLPGNFQRHICDSQCPSFSKRA